MNKIKSLFSLFFCFVLFACITVPPVSAQDYKLGLGKAWIRYDSDSNMLKFGASGQPPKIAREYNAQLFNFNSTQFFWSNLTGLNLNTYNSPDTILAKYLIISRDTGDGEFIPYNKRTYTFYKPYYYNTSDIYDLKVKYESSQSQALNTLPTTYDINLFNNAYTLFEDNNINIDIAEQDYQYDITNFPKPGTYYLDISYSIEYEEIKASLGVGKEESYILLLAPMNDELYRNYHKFIRASEDLSGEVITGQLTYFKKLSAEELHSYFTIRISGSSQSNFKQYLQKLKIIAILLN